jgi:excisionase family DNA binding protein
MAEQLPLVLTVPEVAELLRISRGAAYEAVRAGEIPHVRLGRTIRISRAGLAELLGEQTDAAASRNGGESAETPPRL